MPENAELYNKYKKLADETPNVHFVGALATYKYYNMDQVVAQALDAVQEADGKGKRRQARPPRHFGQHRAGGKAGEPLAAAGVKVARSLCCVRERSEHA